MKIDDPRITRRPHAWLSTFEKGQFAADGVTVFESLLDAAECAMLIHDTDRMVHEGLSTAVDLPAHAALVTHTKLIAIASVILGERFVFHHLHTARHDVGTPGVPWHHDYEQIPQKDRSHTMIHFLIYPSGLNGTIGDLLVLPGSHEVVVDRYTQSSLGTQVLPDSMVIDRLPPGSVVAIHSALLHARRARDGGDKSPRYFVDVSYCESGTRWPSYTERGDWREILRKLRARDCEDGGRHSWLFDEEQFVDV